MNVLVLAKTDISSEDRYKCEVSADAPSFQTIRAEKDLKIYGNINISVRTHYTRKGKLSKKSPLYDNIGVLCTCRIQYI